MNHVIGLFWAVTIVTWLAWIALAFKSDVTAKVRHEVLLVAIVASGLTFYATALSSLPK